MDKYGLRGMVFYILSLVCACSAHAQLPSRLEVKSTYGGAWQSKAVQVMGTLPDFVPQEHPRDQWTEEGSYRLLRSDSTGFYRVEKSRSAGGNGLGLAIAMEIAKRHGWQIEVHSEEGQGSEFEVVSIVRVISSLPSRRR